MVKVGHNFGQKIVCPLCKLHEDSQERILDCVVLKLNCKELYQQKDEKYDHIFSSDMIRVAKISKLFIKCFETREEIMDQMKRQSNQTLSA